MTIAPRLPLPSSLCRRARGASRNSQPPARRRRPPPPQLLNCFCERRLRAPTVASTAAPSRAPIARLYLQATRSIDDDGAPLPPPAVRSTPTESCGARSCRRRGPLTLWRLSPAAATKNWRQGAWATRCKTYNRRRASCRRRRHRCDHDAQRATCSPMHEHASKSWRRKHTDDRRRATSHPQTRTRGHRPLNRRLLLSPPPALKRPVALTMIVSSTLSIKNATERATTASIAQTERQRPHVVITAVVAAITRSPTRSPAPTQPLSPPHRRTRDVAASPSPH